jgi:cellulose synthase operon protein C
LERAWIEGHPPSAVSYFRVARQLESWSMLEEGLHFAELGVKAEGDDLLAGGAPGNQGGDDPDGAVLYARLMTRLRRTEAALDALDAARGAAVVSANSPEVVAEQVERHGIASVTDSEWRKRRAEQREQTAGQRFQSAVMEMGKTAGVYFTPEEKVQFAALVDARFSRASLQSPDERSQWMDVAGAAGITEEEARLRRLVLLEGSGRSGAQFGPYLQLQNTRMEYAELAQTMEIDALRVKPKERQPVWIAAAQAFGNAGDEISELRVLRQIGLEQDNNASLRERYLQLLLKHDAAEFAAAGAASKDEAAALAAPNYAAAHGDVKITQAALSTHAAAFGGLWEKAYTALLGLYFHEPGEGTEGAFHSVLGDQKTVGERVGNAAGKEDGEQRLSGNVWFYYGMRYGVYRTLAPEKEWAGRDPEDLLAAELELNASADNYVGLARAYADAGKIDAALAEYRHALELTPDAPAVHDAMALLEWQAGDKDVAAGEWREGLAALNRLQDKGPAPESFWGSFALILEHVAARKLTARLHPDVDGVLRNYLTRNGNYRSNELLRAAFAASASPGEGVEWLLSLSEAAHDPAGVLADVDTAPRLPKEAREPILLREIGLARIAAAHQDGQNSYAAQRVVELEKSLIVYYVDRMEDAKAQAILGGLTDEQARDGAIQMAQIVLAARSHTLDALLARYRVDSLSLLGPAGAESLRNDAGELAARGDNASALAVWECVFDLGQTHRDLMASDYLGLAEARLRVGNVPGAEELLRRMTPLSGDVYANYDLAAALLEKNGREAEAVEFLTVLAKGVPWDAAYQLRLARAQLHAGAAKPQAVAALKAIAASGAAVYDLRVQAAMALREAGLGDAPGLGSEELRLLAGGKISADLAQRPYFAAARIAAAETAASPALRAMLLRQAIAVAPVGLPNAAGMTGDALRLKIFRAEAALGHDATAVVAIESMLGGSSSPALQTESGNPNESEPEADNAGRAGGESMACGGDSPLPAGVGQMLPAGADRLAVAQEAAGVFERTGRLAEAIPYLKFAACLQGDKALQTALRSRIEQLQTALALEARNAQRRPEIRRALDQSNVVRPRLTTAADLVREEAAP